MFRDLDGDDCRAGGEWPAKVEASASRCPTRKVEDSVVLAAVESIDGNMGNRFVRRFIASFNILNRVFVRYPF